MRHVLYVSFINVYIPQLIRVTFIVNEGLPDLHDVELQFAPKARGKGNRLTLRVKRRQADMLRKLREMIVSVSSFEQSNGPNLLSTQPSLVLSRFKLPHSGRRLFVSNVFAKQTNFGFFATNSLSARLHPTAALRSNC